MKQPLFGVTNVSTIRFLLSKQCVFISRESQEIKSDAKNLLVRALTLGRSADPFASEQRGWNKSYPLLVKNIAIENHQL